MAHDCQYCHERALLLEVCDHGMACKKCADNPLRPGLLAAADIVRAEGSDNPLIPKIVCQFLGAAAARCEKQAGGVDDEG